MTIHVLTITIFTVGTISTVEQAMMTGSCSWRWRGRIGWVWSHCFLYCNPMGRRQSHVEQNDYNECDEGKKSKHHVRHGDLLKRNWK